MSAEVANSNNEIFVTEPKIYVSKATLQLKFNTNDYAWRTEVITPQQTTPVSEGVTETEVAKKHVNEANSGLAVTGEGAATATTVAAVTAGTTAVAAAAAAALHHHNKTPATITPATKPIKIVTAVSDFMHAERSHTENIENMNQFVSRL